MSRRVPLLLILCVPSAFAANAAPAPRTCIGSVPIATFQIRVAPASGGAPLPIRQVNTIAKGYRISCSPIKLPPDLKNNARIALVAVPAPGAGGEGVTVLDLRPLDGPTEWTMPFQVGMVLLVYGPQGLDEKRVTKLVSKDDDLVSELATYADQTEDLEDTIDALAVMEDIGEDDVTADTTAGRGTDQVLFALTKALNPVLAAFNPLGAGKRAGPATNAGKAADMFFENAGGFVPGGGALPVVKTWLMPDTEFRTVYTEPAASGDGLMLCAQRKTTPTRNKFAYLWAHRTVNSGPPTMTLARAAWLPIGARSTAVVKVKSVEEWPLVDRVREWSLVGGAAPAAVKVRSDQRRTIELDLRKTTAPPGTYKLVGKWDWGTAEVSGEFHLAALCDGTKVRTNPESQGMLVDGRGVVPLKLEGSDFEFVERASLKRAGRLGTVPVDLDYVLPIGPRAGPQESIEIEIDTNHFRAGAYQLALAQTGGATQNVPVTVLPAMPRIENLPLRVNTGAKDLRLVLKGTGLDKIEGLAADHATFRLGAAGGGEREVFVTLDAAAKQGDQIALHLGVGGVADAASLPNGVVVAGPRPRIASVKVAPPDDLGTALRDGELPAGSFVGMMAQVESADGQVALRLDCAEAANGLEAVRVRAGQRLAAAKLDALGPGSLYASFDPGAVGTPGCTVQARVETDQAGTSEATPVGKVVRLPRIESVMLTNEKAEGGFAAVLTGWDLAAIEKTGWDAANGVPVSAAPRSVAGEGDKETLRIAVPWPSPTPMEPLFIWLRGDKDGRAASRK